MLALYILVPLLGLLAVSLIPVSASKRVTFPLTLTLALLQGVSVIAMLPPGIDSEIGALGHFFEFGLKMDDLARVVLLAIGLVAAVALVAGRAMISNERQRMNFTTVLLLSLAGMNGVVLLTDLFTLYVFLEVVAVASFVMIAFERGRDGLEGAFKYLVLSAVATVLMLSAVAVFLVVAGGTSYDEVLNAIRTGPAAASGTVRFAVAAFICGLFIKGGLVPFHGWLPGAYTAAPAPVSIFLAGIVTKVSGIYALIRLAGPEGFPLGGGLGTVLLLVGAVSVVVGALAALEQGNMKRLLAYSSISQIGYIVLGLGCGTELGVAAAILHFFNHAVFKSLLFLNAAAVEQRLGTTDMDQLGGLGNRMPVTNATSLIGTLSTAGIPPFAGFWSKFLIIVALWQAGHPVYAIVAIFFSVVTLGYLLGMQRRVFFGKTPVGLEGTTEASGGLLFAAVILAAVTVGMGVFFPWLIGRFVFPFSGPL